MSDIVDPAKRSLMMSRIRGRGNLSTELALAAAFKRQSITGWRRHLLLKPIAVKDDGSSSKKAYRITVRPDFIFRRGKLAIFVDGCFWHGCPLHSKLPTTNAEFWANKISGNIERDKRATKALQSAGWQVIRLWEHELTSPDDVARRVARHLQPGIFSRQYRAKNTTKRGRKKGDVAN